jgi:hypothetical protein
MLQYLRTMVGCQNWLCRCNYTTGELELLSIVEILKEFQNIFLSQYIIVHTDHKKMLYKNLSIKSPR